MKKSRYYEGTPEPETYTPLTISKCPACQIFPVIIIRKPLFSKFNWEVKSEIKCQNEDCQVSPKVVGCVVRRNEHLAHDINTSKMATKLAFDQWPPVINTKLLHASVS